MTRTVDKGKVGVLRMTEWDGTTFVLPYGFNEDLVHALEILQRVEDGMRTGRKVDISKPLRIAAAKALRGSTNIYFIADTGAKMVKIGQAKDMGARKSSLQSSNHVELELLGSVRSHPYMEAALHRIHRDSWKRGEWFRLTNNIVESIKAAQNGPSRLFWHARECLKGDDSGIAEKFMELDEEKLKNILDRYGVP